MELLSSESFLAWAATQGIGRSLQYPSSSDLCFRSPDNTWYRYRLFDQPRREELAALIVTTAAASHGGYLYPTQPAGEWIDPLGQVHVDLQRLGVPLTEAEARAYKGAIHLAPAELHLAIQAMTEALQAGCLWSLSFFPDHAHIVLASDEDPDFMAFFPTGSSLESYNQALARAGWAEPTDPDPRVSATDPWLEL